MQTSRRVDRRGMSRGSPPPHQNGSTVIFERVSWFLRATKIRYREENRNDYATDDIQ